MNFGLKTQTDKTRWEPGLLQHAGVHFQPEPWITPVHPLAGEQASVGWSCREFPATTGAALLISRDLFWRVGGFDEAFEKEAQDVDLCLKVHRLGGRSLVWNLGPVIHLENATRPRGDSSSADRLRLLEKWKNYIELNFLGGQETPWPREQRL
jgi:GT2 family glycosyltransferase